MIDKDKLYGLFIQSCSDRKERQDLAVRKALDLPMADDLNIDQRQYTYGSNPFLLLFTGLLVFGGGFLCANNFGKSPEVPPASPTVVPEVRDTDTDTRYQIRLVDPPEDG